MTTSTNRARAAAGMEVDTVAPSTDVTVSPLERRIAETRAMDEAFRDAVASGLEPQTLIRDAITAVRNVPDLANTTKASFFGALMTAAQLGLRPNVGSLGHGWVLPYRSKGELTAQWILGYQGMVELGYKSGLVTKITAHTVYANDDYSVEFGDSERLVHRPELDRDKRGEMVGHYAVVTLATGDKLWNFITDAEARDTMARSQSKERGPWGSDYVMMARKTALRGLWRYMPKTPILALALSTDGVVREGTTLDTAVVAHPDETPSEDTDVVDAVEVDVNEACPVCGTTTDEHDAEVHAEAGV